MKYMKSLLFVLIISANAIYSLPRFALQYSDNCSSCHVNPTGGGARNENGFYFGKNILSMISPREKDFSLSPKISDNVWLGFDYRTQFLYSQEKKRTDFQDMTGSIYLNVSVAQNIDVSAKYDFVNAIWEAYAIAKILPNNGYIKFGSFTPNFGIRLDDHTAYTRGGDFGLLFSTNTIRGMYLNPFYLETGAELGAYFSDYVFLTASVGKSKFNSIFSADPTFTSRIELTPSIDKLRLSLGASYASAKTRFTGNLLPTEMYGIFGGMGYNRFTISGEYDLASDYLGSDIKSKALMLEASYQIFVGLEAVARYDLFDSDINLPNDEFAHLIFGLEFFPYSFVELRPQYRLNLEDPKVNNNAFVLQLHFWY